MSRNLSTDVLLDVTLDQLNDEKAVRYFGAVIFVGILIFPGVIGNAHVLHIYFYKKPNNTRVFVLFLAAIDLLSCVIIFPSGMVNYLYPLTLYMDVGCKLLTYLACCLSSGEVFTLLAIAVDRYRKICNPFKRQFTPKHAKMICASIILFTFVSTSPVLYLYGSTGIPTKHPNITGNTCKVRMELRGTYTSNFINGTILFISTSVCIILIVLYTLIVRRVWQHQTKMNNLKTSEQRQEQKPVNETNQLQAVNEEARKEPEDSSYLAVSIESSNEVHAMRNFHRSLRKNQGVITKTDRKKFKEMKKMMYMFLLITLFYLLSYIPYPVLQLNKTFNEDWYTGLSHSELVMFHLTIMFIFLNNVVNSFIYMIFDKSYRQEIKSFYSKLFRRQ